MTPGRFPFWAMLAAVWALVLLGGAPAPAVDAMCGVPAHHRTDCIACCTCVVAGPGQAVLSAVAVLPVPRGRALRVPAALPGVVVVMAGALAPRARGPPGFA